MSYYQWDRSARNLPSISVSSGVFIERQTVPGYPNSPKESNGSMKVLSAELVKMEPFIHIEDYLVIEEDVWKQEVTDPDYPTASGGKGKVEFVLERQMLPDSMVHQKNIKNNCTCMYCGKTFNYPHKLKIHLRTHISESLFKFLQCNKRFTLLDILNVHLRIHTGEKPFRCSHCSYMFTQSSSLNLHLRISS